MFRCLIFNKGGLLLLWIFVFASCGNNNRSDNTARDLNTQALEKYGQMRFSSSYRLLDSVNSVTNNQVELMVSDVIRMKISQRTADLRTFYRSWHSAVNRLSHINQERTHLDSLNLMRSIYAESEMHTIASTYYYYMRQDSLSRNEMSMVAPLIQADHDTTEWAQYLYVMGNGGMLTGDSVNIKLSEFDYLLQALTIAHKTGDRYYEANSLQSLAQKLESSSERDFIRSQRNGAYGYLLSQYFSFVDTQAEDSLPLAMIRQSYVLFSQCGDIFQQANVLRTKSELFFNEGRYDLSLHFLKQAQRFVDIQHQRDSLRDPNWEARIAERFSLTYSALGDRYRSAIYRKQYLELMESMSQDLEEEARAEELAEGNFVLYIRLGITVFISIALAIVFFLLLKNVRRRGMRQANKIQAQIEEFHDEALELSERLHREKLQHIERRSKVSLAEAVVPYINRMLHSSDMGYIGELSDRIMQFNDQLTAWIQVQRGRLSMNISTFHLQPLFDTLARNSSTYTSQGLTLQVSDTDLQVKADKVLTLFMLNTLADNARKFTPQGGTVSISATAVDDECVELSVSDTGYGLSNEDVDTLNNNKVWDASRLGSDHKQAKGFGFGLMNCKGVISQMKKASSRFACCDFGVDSQKGHGSRFWFRLPRVLSLVMVFLLGVGISNSRTTSHSENEGKDLYDSLYSCNVQSRYADAVRFGIKALTVIPVDNLSLRMKTENELAFAYEGLGQWDEYHRHNNECMRLHRHLTADPNLPLYAEKLHRLESEANWALILTGIIVLCSLFVFIMIVRVSRRHRIEISLKDDELTLAKEERDRVQFELDRLHVSNQILDNSLSTIKHETMYYPARIRQMVDSGNDISELKEVVQYYNEIYTLLLAQAERQTRWRMRLDGYVLQYMKSLLKSIIKNLAEKSPLPDAEVQWHESDTSERLHMIRLGIPGVTVPENLFTPECGVTDALIVREIIRIHDAESGHPGLRLSVENNEIIITLWKNSKLLS